MEEAGAPDPNGAAETARAIRDRIGSETLRALMHGRESRVFTGIVEEPGALLTTDRVVSLLTSGTFPAEHLRVYARRLPLHGETMGYVVDGRVQARPCAALLAQGVTAIINDLVPVEPGLAPVAALLGDWLRDPIELNCFASFGSESGLPIHHDEMHLLLVQLEGTKHWTLHGPPVPPGAKRVVTGNVEGPERELITRPGDVLFLAAGQRHSARAETASLHMGIMPTHASGKRLLERFLERYAHDVELREPAVAFQAAERDAAVIAGWRARLHQLVDEFDFATELALLRRGATGAGQGD